MQHPSALEPAPERTTVSEPSTIPVASPDRFDWGFHGVSEAPNKDGQEFGDERLINLLSEDRNCAVAGLCKRVGEELSEFADAQRTPHDDRTLLVVRFLSRQISANERGPGAAMAQVA
jgi:Stage II sporulation protein E (SpoIIE)